MRVSIRLADQWPFERDPGDGPRPGGQVSIRLADQWPFEPAAAWSAIAQRSWFQSALRINGPSNPGATWRSKETTGFQSALRINGPSNVDDFGVLWLRDAVSIRLADQWPFEPGTPSRPRLARSCFNPPCGSMALRTGRAPQTQVRALVSIRLADQWPFERGPGLRAHTARSVSIRLADQWPFELPVGVCIEAITRSFNPPCGSMALRTRCT